ncbi:MAG: hypothetical protein JXA30_13805 [Deltaproteobacteria bacterium]|nr:hypothetical protein [Deltaproteobacteria bacterium]
MKPARKTILIAAALVILLIAGSLLLKRHRNDISRSRKARISDSNDLSTGQNPSLPADMMRRSRIRIRKSIFSQPVASLDENALMRRIRDNLTRNPELSLQLAEYHSRRFTDSARSEERDALIIDAMVNLERIGEARSATEDFLAKYPNSPFESHLVTLTGAHRRPGKPEVGSK